MTSIKEATIAHHRSLFGEEDLIIASPGRVNIIGEHTDYNQGLVLPYALDKHIYLCCSSGEDETKVYSLDFRQFLDMSGPVMEESWMSYFYQARKTFLHYYGKCPALNITLSSDLPTGAGVSSSSALTCGIVFLFQNALQLNLKKEEMIRLAVEVEHGTGVRGGTMDQTTIFCAKKNQAIKIDFHNGTKSFVPLDFGEYTAWLVNSDISHSLVDSEYNDRRSECEEAVKVISKNYKPIQHLSELLPRDLDNLSLPEVLKKRVRFVVEENNRVNEAFAFLMKKDMKELGRLLYDSHNGLSTLYEVSTPEIDFFINSLKNHPEVVGARLIGGGFGGSMLALVKKSSHVIHDMVEIYNQKYGKQAFYFEADSSDALKIIS